MTSSGSEYSSSPTFASTDSAGVAVAEQPEPLASLREKPVVVTGAAGLVGSHLCAQLTERGWKVRAVVRNPIKAAQRLGHLKLEIRESDIRDEASLRAALLGAGSIVHLAAIAIERGGQTYADTNTEATRVVLDSARAEGIDRIVYMSQNGADSRSPYAFLKSKGLAEDTVHASGMRWTSLRPSVIFGPEDEFVNVLARLMKLSPVIYPLPGGGTARFQPIAVGDVARAIVKVLEDHSTVHHSYTIGGPVPLTLRQMVERIMVAMNTSRTLVSAPVGVIRPLVAAAQRMLPNPPVTTGLLDLLAIDNVTQPNALHDELGIMPTPFAPEELLYLRGITASAAIRSLFRR